MVQNRDRRREFHQHLMPNPYGQLLTMAKSASLGGRELFSMESYLTAEISASSVQANLQLLRGSLGNSAKLCAVVKADCYGHGLEVLLPTIAPLVDHLAVATPHEALTIRQLGYGGELLAFFSACAFHEASELRELLEELIARQVTLTVVSASEVQAVSQAAMNVGRTARVHVKIDTDMGRSGILWEQAGLLLRLIRGQSHVRLAGAYTHFACADEQDKSVTIQQLENFLNAVEAGGGRGGLTLHAANSAAAIDMPQTHLDMVRPGIALYGYQPSDEMHVRLPLRPALRLVGRLMQVKTVPAGSRCGYGLSHTFLRDSRIGLVPVGYGDGYFRCLSNQAQMRVCGSYVPVVGRVSMDQVTVDLSRVPQARVGDAVEILSSDPAAPNSVENLARLAKTIPYELTCRLGRRVRRILVP